MEDDTEYQEEKRDRKSKMDRATKYSEGGQVSRALYVYVLESPYGFDFVKK